jgi:hypothetical protein
MSNSLKQEKRSRFLENLLKETIINILAEAQQPAPAPQASAVPPATTPPAANMNPADTDVKNPAPTQPAAPAPQQFDVDEMVNKLNVLRGSKSFKDPEVYGRLTTFFKGLDEAKKATLDELLTELGKIVIDASEQQAGIEQQPSQAKQTPSPGSNQTISQGAPPPAAAPAAPVSPAG